MYHPVTEPDLVVLIKSKNCSFLRISLYGVNLPVWYFIVYTALNEVLNEMTWIVTDNTLIYVVWVINRKEISASCSEIDLSKAPGTHCLRVEK